MYNCIQSTLFAHVHLNFPFRCVVVKTSLDSGNWSMASCEAHPELGEQLDKMQKYMTTKLSDTEPFKELTSY